MSIFSDLVLLSRIQFALTIMFHYIFPPLTIGLSTLLVIMEGMYLKTKNPIYEAMTRFWVKIFALNFSIGVATGIVLEFEFGTNWATYARFVGDIFGSALAAEGIFAFFLESGFLAILVFGWDRVSAKMHFFSTVMVAVGSCFSAVWIIIANSWQQTPVGYHIVDPAGNILASPGHPYVFDPFAGGVQPRAEITNFWELVFNPSSVSRILHSVVGGYILAAFVVMSICAWYILKKRHLDFARRAFTIALIFGTFASLSQLFLGHWSGQIAGKYQPAKIAAFEGLFKTEANAGAYLFGFPNVKEQRVDYGVKIPGLLSFLIHNDVNATVIGLDQFEEKDRPPVHIPFQMFHLMVGLGTYFIALTLFACFQLWRGKLFTSRWLMWIFVFSVVLPYIANQAGWIAAEVGRQPWIVYGLLRTSDGVSKSVSAHAVLSSVLLFTFIYSLLGILFVYLLNKKIQHGPDEHAPTPPHLTTESGLVDAVTRRGPGQERLADDAGEVNK